MEMMKHSIKSTPKTHFIKLNNIFSIFIFIFLISFSVSICSYTHHFPNFTNSNDRHYIFLLCNGILFFLFMNFNSTHGSSLKQNQQPVITDQEIDHSPVLVSSAMEPVAAMEEQQEEIEEQEDEIEEEQEEEIEEEREEDIEEEDDDEIERNWNWVYVNEDDNAFSIVQIEDQMAELHQLYVVEEQETEESKEAAETEELNKKCAEFIRNMRETMKCESSYRYGSLHLTKINATISF